MLQTQTWLLCHIEVQVNHWSVHLIRKMFENDRSSSQRHLSIEHQFSWSQILPTKNSGHSGPRITLAICVSRSFQGEGRVPGAGQCPSASSHGHRGNASGVPSPPSDCSIMTIPRTYVAFTVCQVPLQAFPVFNSCQNWTSDQFILISYSPRVPGRLLLVC